MRRTSRGRLALAAAAAAIVMPSTPNLETMAADWPQFRGASRDGRSAETGLLPKWEAAGPRVAWRRPIGEGFSGFAISKDRLYTMYAGEHEGKPTEFAAALEAATGRELWRTPIGEKLDTQFGNGPRATPAVAGEWVYVLGSRGTLASLSAKDGSVRWKLELTEAFGSKVPTWGFSGSPLVDGDKVIIEGGGPKGMSFDAVDAATGKVAWSFGDGPEEPGYGSPLAVELAGRRQYVHFVAGKIRGIDANGKEIWSHPWPEGETHAMPVFIPPDRILGSGVEGVGSALLRIAKGAGGATVTEVWKNPAFRTHFNASIVQGDHLYGFDNATLKCIAVKDGSLAWSKRGLGKGSLVVVDGHLLVLADDGRLLLVEASPKAYVERGSVQALEGRCWTPPAVSDGRVFLRNHTEIVAYDIKG